MGGLNRVVSIRDGSFETFKKDVFFLSKRRLRWPVTGDFKTAGLCWGCHRHGQFIDDGLWRSSAEVSGSSANTGPAAVSSNLAGGDFAGKTLVFNKTAAGKTQENQLTSIFTGVHFK